MSAGPAPRPGLVDSFDGLPVVVIGDTCLDVWYSGQLRGLSREGAAPVVEVLDETASPGGAANTARALAALGADVRFVSVVGDDPEGARVRGLLQDGGVDVTGVLTVRGRRTVTKRRVVGRGQVLARFDTGDTGEPAGDTAALEAAVGAASSGVRAVVAADYAGGVHTERMRAAVAAAAGRSGALFVVDAHDPARWATHRPALVTPDAEEIETLLDGESLADFRAGRTAHLRRHGQSLRRRLGAGALLATLDTDGAVVVTPGSPAEHVPVRPVDGAPGTGAGDTFVAAATLAALVTGDTVLAARVGCAAAGVSVRRPGTPVCTSDDLRQALVPPVAARSAARAPVVAPHDVLVAEVEAHRRAGRRIVLTNGCFDVLHRGHIAYLDAARACGDVLVVGVNSDESVRRLKGADRPVNPAEDRSAVLAGLAAVDRVTVFEGDTAVDLVRLLRPDVYVKGGDYTADMLVEAPVVRELGGEVRIVDYLADRSTTALLERVRSGG